MCFVSEFLLLSHQFQLRQGNDMGVDWDSHLLSPLHDVFGDEHEYRPRNGTPFTINGIFDRG